MWFGNKPPNYTYRPPAIPTSSTSARENTTQINPCPTHGLSSCFAATNSNYYLHAPFLLYLSETTPDWNRKRYLWYFPINTLNTGQTLHLRSSQLRQFPWNQFNGEDSWWRQVSDERPGSLRYFLWSKPLKNAVKATWKVVESPLIPLYRAKNVGDVGDEGTCGICAGSACLSTLAEKAYVQEICKHDEHSLSERYK